MEEASADNSTAVPTSTIWVNKVKGAPNQKMVKNNVTNNRSTDAYKKLCLCSPTNHAGSFKCRLHRVGATHKRLPGVNSSSTQSFSLENMNLNGGKVSGESKLSRFGRAATAADDAQLTTTGLQQRENLNESYRETLTSI